ncbi:MAG TPA: serine/threonine-protein kinase [Pseudonocardiaceae bacterium]|nr:serine/threonine-protein kinase [Pseudonocardiaceae bacterium]
MVNTTRRTIAGRYELTAPIGQGGMGRVWEAYDTRLDRRVALKVLRPDVLPTGTAGRSVLARFRREARLTARLEHPGVPAVFDVGVDDGQLYLVMQLVDGKDLGDVLAERGRLPVDWAAAIGAQIAAVLVGAHALSLVHRDLKPRNVMLSSGGVVRVLDFGVAALLDPELTRVTAVGETVGSPAYMSPEQVTSSTVSPRSDLYALGCVLHELLSGQQVFPAKGGAPMMYAHAYAEPQKLRELRAEVPEPLERLVLDLLAKDPEARPADAEAVYLRLQPFLPPAIPTTAGSGELEPADPTRPYRYPLAPRPKPTGVSGPAKATPVADPPVDSVVLGDVRDQAADLADEGRFTQAAELLAGFLASAPRHGPAMLNLRLQLAGTLVLGGDYRRALPEYQRLARELAALRGEEDEEVLGCRTQIALCHAELGELTDAVREFRVILDVQRRVHGPSHTEVFELRRQIGLLLASSGDVSSATRELHNLLVDEERELGPEHPDVRNLRAVLRRLGELDR